MYLKFLLISHVLIQFLFSNGSVLNKKWSTELDSSHERYANKHEKQFHHNRGINKYAHDWWHNKGPKHHKNFDSHENKPKKTTKIHPIHIKCTQKTTIKTTPTTTITTISTTKTTTTSTATTTTTTTTTKTTTTTATTTTSTTTTTTTTATTTTTTTTTTLITTTATVITTTTITFPKDLCSSIVPGQTQLYGQNNDNTADSTFTVDLTTVNTMTVYAGQYILGVGFAFVNGTNATYGHTVRISDEITQISSFDLSGGKKIVKVNIRSGWWMDFMQYTVWDPTTKATTNTTQIGAQGGDPSSISLPNMFVTSFTGHVATAPFFDYPWLRQWLVTYAICNVNN